MQLMATIGIIVFGIFQLLINNRLAKVQDYIALSIIPSDNSIKLINTGKNNLYIHAFEIDGKIKKLDRGRLISSASLDSAYYWIPVDFVPRESNNFGIKIYLSDESGAKYLTEGGGESTKLSDKESRVIVWTYKTTKSDWRF